MIYFFHVRLSSSSPPICAAFRPSSGFNKFRLCTCPADTEARRPSHLSEVLKEAATSKAGPLASSFLMTAAINLLVPLAGCAACNGSAAWCGAALLSQQPQRQGELQCRGFPENRELPFPRERSIKTLWFAGEEVAEAPKSC